MEVILDHCGLMPEINGRVSEFFNGETAAAQLFVNQRALGIRSLSSGMRGEVRECRLLGEQQDRRQQP